MFSKYPSRVRAIILAVTISLASFLSGCFWQQDVTKHQTAQDTLPVATAAAVSDPITSTSAIPSASPTPTLSSTPKSTPWVRNINRPTTPELTPDEVLMLEPLALALAELTKLKSPDHARQLFALQDGQTTDCADDKKCKAFQIFHGFITDTNTPRKMKINVLWGLVTIAKTVEHEEFVLDILMQIGANEKYQEIIQYINITDIPRIKRRLFELLVNMLINPEIKSETGAAADSANSSLTAKEQKEILNVIAKFNTLDDPLLLKALKSFLLRASPQSTLTTLTELKLQNVITEEQNLDLKTMVAFNKAEAKEIIVPSLLTDLRDASTEEIRKKSNKHLFREIVRTDVQPTKTPKETSPPLQNEPFQTPLILNSVQVELIAYLQENKPPSWKSLPMGYPMQNWLEENHLWFSAYGSITDNSISFLLKTISESKDPLDQAALLLFADDGMLSQFSDRDLMKFIQLLESQKNNYTVEEERLVFSSASANVAEYLYAKNQVTEPSPTLNS